MSITSRLSTRLAALEQEHADLEAQLADPAIVSDPSELRRVSTRYRELGPIVDAARRHRQLADDAEAARELLEEADGDDRALLEGELSAGNTALVAVEEELRELLIPPDP